MSDKNVKRMGEPATFSILHELAKCDVRCRDCHQDRHALERMRHGIGRYKAGCRCDVCRLAKREEGQRYYRPSRAGEDV